jgi:hypothetical protein
MTDAKPIAGWTAREETTLKKMWRADVPLRDITAALPGRPVRLVRHHIYYLMARGELQKRRLSRVDKLTPEIRRLFERAVRGGLTVHRLMEIFDVDTDTITLWKRETGLVGLRFASGVETKKRRCLGWCEGDHDSTGPGDRLCVPCKMRGEWQSAARDASLVGVSSRG